MEIQDGAGLGPAFYFLLVIIAQEKHAVIAPDAQISRLPLLRRASPTWLRLRLQRSPCVDAVAEKLMPNDSWADENRIRAGAVPVSYTHLTLPTILRV